MNARGGPRAHSIFAAVDTARIQYPRAGKRMVFRLPRRKSVPSVPHAGSGGTSRPLQTVTPQNSAPAPDSTRFQPLFSPR